MYIETHTKEKMISSVCDALKMSWSVLQFWLRQIDMKSQNADEFDQMLCKWIDEKLVKFPNEILFFHLSRRLHGTEGDVEGRNLADLLTSENAFSAIMKREEIEFHRGEQHIDTYYKGRLVDWDECHNGNSGYMKSRLGYIRGREDYCFNGFAFKDLLYKNCYARDLYNCPEFLGQLVACLGCNDIIQYYIENSSYFCYEYKLPLETVMFDAHDTYSLEEKQRYLIKCVLKRIAIYQNCEPEYMLDYDNPILRLADDYTIAPRYYVDRERITYNMLS